MKKPLGGVEWSDSPGSVSFGSAFERCSERTKGNLLKDFGSGSQERWKEQASAGTQAQSQLQRSLVIHVLQGEPATNEMLL